MGKGAYATTARKGAHDNGSHRFRLLQQPDVFHYGGFSEREAERYLKKCGLFSDPRRSRDCHRCGEPCSVSATRVRCKKKSCGVDVKSPSLAYTILGDLRRSGNAVCYRVLLRTLYAFGMQNPIDSARFLIGMNTGEEAVAHCYRKLRICCAYSQLKSGRSADLGQDIVEVDATKVMVDRTSKQKQNIHRGRLLVFKSRNSKKVRLEPMPSRAVKGKGGKAPKKGIGAEAVHEVRRPIQSAIKKGAIQSCDSSQAFFSARASGVPIITVKHSTVKGQGQWTKKCKLEPSKMTRQLQRTVSKASGVSMPKVQDAKKKGKTITVRAGSQCCEGYTGNLKDGLRRWNLKKSHPGGTEEQKDAMVMVNALSTAYLLQKPGLDSVVAAVREYREDIEFTCEPADVFNKLWWLTPDTE
eukprot:TRINITY_DN58310_c0_g1_i1.p1 TRINITY_DN58310_c0_g1~~TRINITY_DN58310_c0_g1_i1.p1  ORF type:complete len:412 (-),score=38.85 TRINITY_DN58310_c0_g1_i1:137-1372(-)